MNENFKPSRIMLCWIMAFLLVIVFFATSKFVNDYWRVELVKRGHAKWVVKDDKGTVQWEWVTSK